METWSISGLLSSSLIVFSGLGYLHGVRGTVQHSKGGTAEKSSLTHKDKESLKKYCDSNSCLNLVLS